MRTCLSFAEFTYIESLVLMRTCLSFAAIAMPWPTVSERRCRTWLAQGHVAREAPQQVAVHLLHHRAVGELAPAPFPRHGGEQHTAASWSASMDVE